MRKGVKNYFNYSNYLTVDTDFVLCGLMKGVCCLYLAFMWPYLPHLWCW